MRKCLSLQIVVFLAFLGLTPLARAQQGRMYTSVFKPVVRFGEEDTVASFSYSAPCNGWIGNEQGYPNEFFRKIYVNEKDVYGSTWSSSSGVVIWKGRKAGTSTETARYYCYTDSKAGACGHWYGLDSVVVTVTVLPDTVLWLSPADALVLCAPAQGKTWMGSQQLILRNPRSTAVTLDGWEITDPNIASFSISKKGQSITSLVVGPDSRDTFQIDFVSKNGSTSRDTSLYETLRTIVREGPLTDTRSSAFTLRLRSAPFKPKIAISDSALRFRTKTHEAASLRLEAKYDKGTVSLKESSLLNPFVISLRTETDSSSIFAISVLPKRSSFYFDTLRLRFSGVDVQGTQRDTEYLVMLTDEISDSGEESEWAPVSKGLNVRRYSRDVLFSMTEKGLNRSTDEGNSWEVFDTSFTRLGGFGIEDSGRIVAIGERAKVPGMWRSQPGGLPPWTDLHFKPVRKEPSHYYLFDVLGEKYYTTTVMEVYPVYIEPTGLPLSYYAPIAEFGTRGSKITLAVDSNYDRHEGSAGYFGRSNHRFAKASFQGRLKCLDVVKNSIIFGATDNRVIISEDTGKSWRTADIALKNINSLATDLDGNVYVATEIGGVVRSTDQGRSWDGMNGGLDGRNVKHLLSYPGGHLMLEFLSGDIYRSREVLPIDGVWSVVGEHVSPTSSHAPVIPYPNPASTFVTIRLPDQLLNRRIRIVDPLGRELPLPEGSITRFGDRITISNLKAAAGTYFLLIGNSEPLASIPFVVE